MSEVSMLVNKGHIQRPYITHIPWTYKVEIMKSVVLQLTPLWHDCDWHIFKIHIQGRLQKEGGLYNYQEDKITKSTRLWREQFTQRQVITKKTRFTSHSTTSHDIPIMFIITTTNHNKIDTRLNITSEGLHLIKAVARDQGIGPWLHAPQSHKFQQLGPLLPQDNCSPLPNSTVAWSAQVQTPHQWQETWQVGARE
jgi:hypothetical protein